MKEKFLSSSKTIWSNNFKKPFLHSIISFCRIETKVGLWHFKTFLNGEKLYISDFFNRTINHNVLDSELYFLELKKTFYMQSRMFKKYCLKPFLLNSLMGRKSTFDSFSVHLLKLLKFKHLLICDAFKTVIVCRPILRLWDVQRLRNSSWRFWRKFVDGSKPTFQLRQSEEVRHGEDLGEVRILDKARRENQILETKIFCSQKRNPLLLEVSSM